MGAYLPMQLTSAGQTLYAKVQSGTALTFTRCQIGTGQAAATATLNQTIAQGTVYTSLTVNALSGAIGSGSTLTLASGQTVTISSSVSAGATSIPANSFTATQNVASGSSISISQNWSTYTSLLSAVSYFNINSIGVNSSTANINAIFQNTNLSSATYTCEIGLFADDPTAGEILYAYANAGANGDTIPPISSGPASWQFPISVSIGSATNVTPTIPIDTYVLASAVGVASGVATLDAYEKVPYSQLGNILDAINTWSAANNASALWTFNAGITGTGTIGTLGLGAGALGNTSAWTTTQDMNITGNAATATTAAQLGGIPAADYIRGDAGAPSSQTVANPINLADNTQIGDATNGFARVVAYASGVYIEGVNGAQNGSISLWLTGLGTVATPVHTHSNTLDDGSGNATFAGTMTVAGSATFNGGVQVNSSFSVGSTGNGVPISLTDTNFVPSGVATSSNNYQSYTQYFKASYWNGSASATYEHFVAENPNGILTISSGTVPGAVLIDQSGNLAVTGSITAASGQLGSASGEWTPASGTFNVAAGTVINVASVPSGAKMFYAGWGGGYGISATIGSMSSSQSSWTVGVTGGYAGISSSTVTGSCSEVYDGSYVAGGYYQINSGYLQFVTVTTPSTSANAQNTMRWVVS